MNLVHLLVIFVAVVVESVPPPKPSTGTKGMVGMRQSDKTQHVSSSLRFFKMRNVVTAWYCNSNEPNASSASPCINLYDFDKPSKVTVISDYKSMYAAFCEKALTHKHHDVICNDTIFKKTYLTQ
jgi:trehalose-6-phosphate synthase